MSAPSGPQSVGSPPNPGSTNGFDAQFVAVVGGGFLTTAYLLARTLARVSGKGDEGDAVRCCDTARVRWTDAAKKWGTANDSAAPSATFRLLRNARYSYGRCFELDIELPVEDVQDWLRKNQYAPGNILVDVYGASVPYAARMVLPQTSAGGYIDVRVNDPSKYDHTGGALKSSNSDNSNANKSKSDKKKGGNEDGKSNNGNGKSNDNSSEESKEQKSGNIRVKLAIGKPDWKDKVTKKLTELREAGDHLLVVELKQRPGSRYGYSSASGSDGPTVPGCLCAVPLKPSEILKSLESGDVGKESEVCFASNPASANSLSGIDLLRATAVETEAATDLLKTIKAYRPRQRTVIEIFMRYAICPLLTLYGAWALLYKKDEILAKAPSFPGFSWTEGARELHRVLPPVPADLLQAFDLGGLCKQVQLLGGDMGGTPTPDQEKHLVEARKILGISEADAARQGVVNGEDLCLIREEIVRLLEQRSIAQKVGGLFSFVNTMWALAIGGIAISVGPVVWLLTKPIRQLMMKFATKIKDLIVWLFEKIIIPLVARCHEFGVWEVLFHFLSFLLVAQAARMPGNSREAAANAPWMPTGSHAYVALSGLVLTHFALQYSQKVHDADDQMRYKLLPGDSRVQWHALHMLVRGLICAPAAIEHQSTMLGYATVLSLLSALGFGGAIYPFCYCIGWDGEDAMVRTCLACGGLLVAFVAARIQGLMIERAADGASGSSILGIPTAHYLNPFTSAVSTLGGLGHFLALLILSNRYYHGSHSSSYSDKDKKKSEGVLSFYAKYNMGAMVSMVAFQFLGRIYGLDGLANTATVFSILWSLEKAHEIAPGMNIWFVVFSGSVAMYYTALWLHANPEFVVSCFRMVDNV